MGDSRSRHEAGFLTGIPEYFGNWFILAPIGHHIDSPIVDAFAPTP